VAARESAVGTLAARRGDRLVGLASLGLLAGGGAELAALYVAPAEQGRGIGMALWERSVAEFRKLNCVRMEVWTLARAPACHFYEARGCSAAGHGSFAVAGHREPAVGYALDLSSALFSSRSPSSPTR
jgi:ribosomal protein S18 acetylase RimI-like enzyme